MKTLSYFALGLLVCFTCYVLGLSGGYDLGVSVGKAEQITHSLHLKHNGKDCTDDQCHLEAE